MTFFQTLKNAVIHPTQLNQSKNMKGWKVFLYLLLLTIMLTIPTAFTASQSFSNMMTSVTTFLDHAPNFTIKDGTLTTNEKIKGFIYESDGIKLSFDPNDKQSPKQLLDGLGDDLMGMSLMKHQFVFAVQKDNMAAQMLPNNPFVVSYKGSNLEGVSKSTLQQLINNPMVQSTFTTMMFLFSFIPVLINLCMNLLFTSVIALLYCKMSRLSLRFGQVFKLMTFSTTLPAIVALIIQLIFKDVPLLNYVYVFNLLIFFLAVKNESSQRV